LRSLSPGCAALALFSDNKTGINPTKFVANQG
jgi:hypothetical protein